MALSDGKWIRLAGDSFDVEAVVNQFDDPPAVSFGFREDEGGWWMKAAAFDSIDDAAEIRSVADDILGTINGCAQVLWGNHQPVGTDQVVYFVNTPPGRNEQVVLLGMVVDRTRVWPPTLVGDREPEPSRSVTWLKTALADPDVAAALRILGKAQPTWAELYHFIELVEGRIGQTVSEASWISRAERSRFRRTANSRRAVGEQARHGIGHEPPADPMSLERARAMARGVAERLLGWPR